MNASDSRFSKSLPFLFLILITCLSVSISGCGSGGGTGGNGPAVKVQDPNAGQFAIDFSTCFEDDDTALANPSTLNFSEVCSIGMGQSTRSLENAEFTVEAQIMPRETDGGIFSRGVDAAGILLFISDSTPKFAMKKNRITAYTVDSGYRLVDNEWAHVAATLVDEQHGNIFTPEHGRCDTGNVGSHTSIAMDTNGKLHVSYYNEDSKALMYANNTAGFWQSASVDDPSPTVGQYSSISVDALDSNSVHISYYDATNLTLKYAYCAGTCTNPANWTKATITSSNNRGRSTSIVANNKDVHISYLRSYNSSNDNDLMYARCPAANSPCTVIGDWSEITVEADAAPGSLTSDGSGYNTSLAMAPNGNLHISYLKKNNTAVTNELKHAKCTVASCTTTGNWTKTVVDSSIGVIDTGLASGQMTSIDAYSDNTASISYYNAATADLKHATNSSGVWVINSIDDTGNVGQFSSLDVDSSDNVHISYFDATNSSLRYAVCTDGSNCSIGGNWSMTNVDTIADVGRFSSIITDPSTPGLVDYAHISYYDMSTIGDLKHASNSSGSLVTEVAAPGTENDAANETPHLDIYVNGEFSNCASTNSNFSDPLDETAVVFEEIIGDAVGNDDGICEQPAEVCIEVIGDVNGNGTPIGNDDGICASNGTEDCLGREFNDIEEQIGAIQGYWQGFAINPSTRLNAVVDELRFWKVTRSKAELQECMNGELSVSGGTCGIDDATRLIGYWKFNAGEGVEVHGYSGAGGGGSKNLCNNTDRVGDDNKTWAGGHVSTDVRIPDGDVADTVYINPANEVLYVNPNNDAEIVPLGLVKRLDLSDIDCSGPTADLSPWEEGWLDISGNSWLH